eukprot:TRINITY_DN3806_c0_g1_i1.p1 TRINITY_DN3806_c0_g1~~TRINITY_DN3806_c0_g1_i1.p1  ORF type:complete len:328 (+),score=102.08 TRINITY_DN3806_c0_g1_i1:29-1012(+)
MDDPSLKEHMNVLRPSKRRKGIIVDSKRDDEDSAARSKIDRKLKRLETVEGEEDEEEIEDPRKQNDKFKDMGYTIEPFNLREERRDGEFDVQGNFQAMKKANRDYDAWADGEYEEQMELYKAKGNQFPATSSSKISDDQEAEKVDIEALKKKVLSLLEPKETVAGALKRLGKDLPKGKQKVKVTTPFDELTEAAHALLSNGFFSIYHLPKEKIAAEVATKEDSDSEDDLPAWKKERLAKEKAEAEKKLQPTSKVMWEYKAANNGELFGPYTTQDMIAWRDMGYFVGDNVVEMRKVKNPHAEESIFDDEDGAPTEYVRSDTVDFSKFL